MGDASERDRTAGTYWRNNLILVSILLTIWFVVAFVLSIFFIEELNQILIGKIGLGFWMAQQGSIFVFVFLVLAYALVMDRLDKAVEHERIGGGK